LPKEIHTDKVVSQHKCDDQQFHQYEKDPNNQSPNQVIVFKKTQHMTF